MSTWNQWYKKTFTPKGIVWIKEKREERQKRIRENTDPSKIHVFESQDESEPLWVGDCGEWATARYLEEKKSLTRCEGEIKDDFIMSFIYPRGYDVDSYDIEIPFLKPFGKDKIDVKTSQRTVDLRENYYCPVTARNYKKIIKPDNPINVLVFASLNTKVNQVTVAGWLLKTEFIKKCIFRPAGVEDEDGWKPREDCYSVKVSQLESLDKL